MGSKIFVYFFLIFLGQRGMHLIKALHLYHSLEILKRGVNGYHSEMVAIHSSLKVRSWVRQPLQAIP